MNQVSQFINALYPDTEGNHILIWSKGENSKLSRWFSDPEAASNYINTAMAGQSEENIYIGAGLSPTQNGPYNRCKKEDIIGIPGLWVDIDIQSDAHKKQNLPPDHDAAIDLLNQFEVQPTIVINSGHGLQAWWLFREIWFFDSAHERDEAEMIVKRLTYTFRKMARQRGWDVDATFDLSRVFRVPGTRNTKRQPFMPVTTLSFEENNRYNPMDFEFYMIDESEIDVLKPTRVEKINSNLIHNQNAKPPWEKWNLLCEVEPRATESFYRKRKDIQDQSPSSYDMSLAGFAALYKWEDQEIADLLIAARAHNGEDLSKVLERPDYIARTIAKARAAAEAYHAEEALEELEIEETPEDRKVEYDEPKKNDILGNISTLFRVNIERVIKYTSDPPQYRLETREGSITLGDVSNLINQAKLRNALAAATGRYLPKIKADQWDTYAQILLNVCEIEDAGEDSTDKGTMSNWIKAYLQQASVHDLDSDPDAETDVYESRDPFIKEGEHYIIGAKFKQFVRINMRENISGKDMGVKLRVLGAESKTVAFRKADGNRSTRSAWIIPEEVFR